MASGSLDHGPRFDCWGLEMAPVRHASERRAERRRVRVAWLRMGWLALVVAAASALTSHIVG